MAKFGSDKPGLRPGLEIQDLRESFRESKFRVFKEIVAKGGMEDEDHSLYAVGRRGGPVATVALRLE